MSIIKRAVTKRIRLIRSKQFPVDRIIGKHLAWTGRLHHQELLDKYDKFGRSGYDWRNTKYFSGAVAPAEHLDLMFPSLPAGLEKKPVWWMMPWAFYPQKEHRELNSADLEEKVLKKIDEFFDLYESIKTHGYSDAKGGAVAGFLLKHPKHGVIFNQIDGHHRLSILNHLNAKSGLNVSTIAVFTLGEVHRVSLSSCPCFIKGVEHGYFTEEDAFLLFDNCFLQLNGQNTHD